MSSEKHSVTDVEKSLRGHHKVLLLHTKYFLGFLRSNSTLLKPHKRLQSCVPWSFLASFGSKTNHRSSILLTLEGEVRLRVLSSLWVSSRIISTLLKSNQRPELSRRRPAICSANAGVLPRPSKVVSSTNRGVFPFRNPSMSVIAARMRIGPKKDPCGTPWGTRLLHELAPIMDTRYSYMSHSGTRKTFREPPRTPYSYRFPSRISYRTTSKALLRSHIIILVSSPSLNAF